MDFSKINDRDTHEAGEFCHFCYPTPDQPMMHEGKPQGAQVRGMESFAVRKALNRIARDGLKGDAAGKVLLNALVIKFINIDGPDGAPLKADEAGIAWLIDRSAKFERQIVQFSDKMGNATEAASED